MPPASHFATCPRGLEALLEAELITAGGSVVRSLPAGVLFTGNAEVEMRLNLHSRIATRVLRKVGFTRYRKEEHIYRAALDMPWPEWFTVNKTIAVKVGAQNSPLKSLNFITLKIKDAICDRFREETRERPSVDTDAPNVPVYAFLTSDAATFYLDTSGEPLFKRGYRVEAGAASLKENLAAGLVMLSGWEPGTPLFDPMCGAGTILLEAADIALNRAPGRGRHFAFEHYRDFDAALWQRIRAEATAQEKPLTRLPLFGADQDRWVLDKARNNLAAAGLDKAIELRVADALSLTAPTPIGTLITNLPYGERLGDADDLADWYPKLGDWLKKNFAGWDAWIISGDPLLPKVIGLKAKRRIPLFNGPLETRYLHYQLVAGFMRPDKTRPAPESAV